MFGWSCLAMGWNEAPRVVEFRKGSGFPFVDHAFNAGRCEFRECFLTWQSATG